MGRSCVRQRSKRILLQLTAANDVQHGSIAVQQVFEVFWSSELMVSRICPSSFMADVC